MEELVGRAYWALSADNKELERDLRAAEGKAKVSGDRSGDDYQKGWAKGTGKIKEHLGTVTKALAAVGIAVGLSTVIGFFGDAIGAASDLNETVSMTGQVLGQEALPELEAWAEGAAEAFGQSKQLALDGASTFAIFGKSAGLAGDELVGFSTELVELAADMASMKNTSPEEAIQAIGAALRGESEPIRRYGVLLDDATLRQRAMTLGIIETTSQALTPQQRVLAAQAEMFAQTSDAQGDYARTSGGLAGQQKELRAKLENVTAKLGEKLLPVMIALATFANDVLVPALEGIVGYFETAGQNIGEFADTLNDFQTNARINAGDLSQAIYDHAQKIGADVGEMREHVRTAMVDMGMDFDEAITHAERRLAGLPTAMSTASYATYHAWKQQEAAITETITQPFVEGTKTAVEEVSKLPGESADAMLANQFELTDATAQLVEFMAQALTPAQERFNAEAFLASQELANGLNSGIPSVRRKAEEMRDAAQAKLNELNGWQAGYNTGTTLANGIDASLWRIHQAASNAAWTMRNVIGIASEPRDPSSPLRGITKWGGNIVDTLVASGRARLGAAEAFAYELATAVRPQMNPSLDLGLLGAVANGGHIVIDFNVHDRDGGLARAGIGTAELSRRLAADIVLSTPRRF